MYDTRNTRVTPPPPRSAPLAHGCLSKCKSEPRYCCRLCAALPQLLGNSSQRQYCTGGTANHQRLLPELGFAFVIYFFLLNRGDKHVACNLIYSTMRRKASRSSPPPPGAPPRVGCVSIVILCRAVKSPRQIKARRTSEGNQNKRTRRAAQTENETQRRQTKPPKKTKPRTLLRCNICYIYVKGKGFPEQTSLGNNPFR